MSDKCRIARYRYGRLEETLSIIALTASAMKEDQEKAYASGMNDFLSKPIDVQKLKEKLLYWGKKA
jgi:CheY-like chemotaxis protein